jgi:hypothetical protein
MVNSQSNSAFEYLPSATEAEELLNLAPDDRIWQSLKQAIAASSGFQRWRLEQNLDTNLTNLDSLVRRYLRETLETLAY